MTDDPESSGKPINFLEAARQIKARKTGGAASKVAARRDSSDTVIPGVSRYAQAAFDREVERVRIATEGTRNDTLNSAAFALGQLVSGGELSELDVIDALTAAARTVGLDDREIERTITSGLSSGKQNPRRTPPTNLPVNHAQPATPKPPTQELSALPEEFWAARPYLSHIRQAAWARGRSAEAVLGAALARVAAGVSHQIKLPPLVGARCGLSLITALVGDPAAGKSTAAAIARQIIPPRNIPPECDGVPPGSGEGLIELLFGWESEVDPITNKGTKVKRQQRYNCYCYVDEGEILSQQSKSYQGTTFWTVMRSAFTDGVLGQSNANEERKRQVPSGQYVYGIVVALQPLKAGPVFADESGGTPQRVLWVDADTQVPEPKSRPDFPGKLQLAGFDNPKSDPFEPAYRIMDISQVISDEIVMNDHRKRIEKGNPLDSHTDLIQLKVAAILAILDGRTSVTEEDWRLALMVIDASKATRDNVLKELDKEKHKKIVARGKAQSVVEGIVEEARGERYENAMAMAERNILARLSKHQAEHPDGTCSRKCLTPAVASKARQVIGGTEGVREALDRLVGRGLIMIVGQDRYQLS